MDDLMSTLIGRAKERYGTVVPCHDKKSLRECFTIYGNTLILWFNTVNESTRCVSCPVEVRDRR